MILSHTNPPQSFQWFWHMPVYESIIHLTRSLLVFLISLGMGVVFVLLLYRKLNDYSIIHLYLYIFISHTILNAFRGCIIVGRLLLSMICDFKILMKVKMLVTQTCLTLCDPVDCCLPGSSVHGILQARILEWIAIPLSRGSSLPRDRTWLSCIAG